MGETVRLQASDGHGFDAYVARPQGDPKTGLVVCQEVFGVNEHIREVADSFAEAGYLTIAPHLFDRIERGVSLGYGPDDLDYGRSLRARIDWDDAALDIEAAVKRLREELGQDARIGVVGYCWGGSLAWLAACRLPVQAAVGYYGGQIYELNDEDPRCPTMLHFGEEDPIIAFDQVEAIREAHPDVIDHVYRAGHGFNCDRREDYDEAAANLARSRTLAFLAQHLG
ncbi:dienelactone hydrolase family protein [Ferruginivarius sediminum]|uniref:Dienelactone hydrolase family protein n=1 Tax=Ferruginivarius sediminum TaxID=2661937 RepID=A0A369TDP0_9PROT|nr:dienelactone hydrolase family protein [Ferruginivarius sediminum]RDD62644.1 dienelactone hydrolase family protein [Ferruginivarius sediminum]